METMSAPEEEERKCEQFVCVRVDALSHP